MRCKHDVDGTDCFACYPHEIAALKSEIKSLHLRLDAKGMEAAGWEISNNYAVEENAKLMEVARAAESMSIAYATCSERDRDITAGKLQEAIEKWRGKE